MPDKEKRKSNPRRRLLIRLLMGIAIIVVLISAGYYTLRPKGAQIVFIAPDDNGVDNIWIADLNDPENPRQLTLFETRPLINYYRASENNHILLYTTRILNSYQQSINILNLETGRNEQILTCLKYMCHALTLHPNGEWLAYLNNTIGERNEWITSVHILNLITYESFVVDEFPSPTYTLDDPELIWAGNTNILVFENIHNRASSYKYVFYNVEERHIADLQIINTVLNPSFSNDGIIYSSMFPGTDQKITFHNIINPDDNIYSIDSGVNITDWHPDNGHILFTMRRTCVGCSSFHFELGEFNIISGETVIISTTSPHGRGYHDVTYNFDGTSVLFTTTNVNLGVSQIMLYDMETGEEISLPLFGSNPQWVNGGR